MTGDGTWATTLRNLRKAVGYREGAHNANMFSKALGRPAEFWCADFAEYELMISGVPRIGLSAYTPKVEAQYKKAGRLGTTPRLGAQFFLYSPAMGRVFHTGIVIGLLPGNRVRTIEGNTNDDGSSNGNGVYLRIRPALRASGRAGIRSYGYPGYTPPKPKPASTAAIIRKAAAITAIQKLIGDVAVNGQLSDETQIRFHAVRHTCKRFPLPNRLRIAALQQVVGVRPLPSPRWGPATDTAFRRFGFKP